MGPVIYELSKYKGMFIEVENEINWLFIINLNTIKFGKAYINYTASHGSMEEDHQRSAIMVCAY